MRSIQQWPTPRKGCRVSMVRIARIAAGPLGPFGRTDQAWHHRHHTDGLWCYCWKSGLEIGLLDSHKGCGSEPLERSLCEAFQKIQQKFSGTVFLGKIGKWIWLHKTFILYVIIIYIYTYTSSSYTSAAAFRQPDGKLSSKVMQGKENELNSRNCIRYSNQAGKQDHRNQSLERGLFQFGECCAGMLLQ